MISAALLFLPSLAQPSTIESQLAEIESGAKGKLGAAIITPISRHFSRRGERFSLQSVMKLVVAMAALDQVDQGRWKQDQEFQFRRSDLSLSVQPLADRLGKKAAITVSMKDCIDLTVTQSCSASGDFLIRKMGGTAVVNAFLRKRGIRGMSIDRQERDLQTNVVGLIWRPEFVDARKLDAATAAQPENLRHAAYERYQADPRDTTTPEAMGQLLQKLVTGKLLSPRSTRYLMGVMERTLTGANRLAAGVPAEWKLGHKTGTSSSSRGIACATNDVGFARNAAGDWVIVVALLRDSKLAYEERENVLAQVAHVAFHGR